MNCRPLVPLVLALVALSGACTDDQTPVPDGDSANDAPVGLVPAGKGDDYRSTTGQEYMLQGLDFVQLTGTDVDLTGEARDARALELVEARFKALSFFTYAYLAVKSSHDSNSEYGGFRTTVRQQTFESYDISERRDEPGTFDFLFGAEVGGPEQLIAQLPIREDGTFDLIVPILSNDELETGGYSTRYKNFNPDDWTEEELTRVELSVEVQENEPNAYPDYNALYADGVLDVSIVVGGDYNDSRWDLTTARDLFEALQSDLGLEAPVGSYEELLSDSGPFVGKLDANGETVEIKVYLFHPDMQKEEGVGFEGLLQIYRDSAAQRDIVIYDGHAGYRSDYSGVVVHYNPRHAIAADDFDELELPDKYQIFVMNGCKTYTSYADALYANPAKNTSNLDVITTVNFSWLSQMTKVTAGFVGHLTAADDGSHMPKSYDLILADMNRGRSWDVIYGVHGLSDNPRISPYANLDTLGESCSANSECPGLDNLCVASSTDGSTCAAACTDDTGCPSDFSCREIIRQDSIVASASQCVP